MSPVEYADAVHVSGKDPTRTIARRPAGARASCADASWRAAGVCVLPLVRWATAALIRSARSDVSGCTTDGREPADTRATGTSTGSSRTNWVTPAVAAP